MKNQEIKDVLGQKRAYKSSSFLLYIVERKDFKTRNVAILVPKKKYKTAVQRNKVKRSVKASLNELKEYKEFIKKHNIIFSIIDGGLVSMPYIEIKNEIQRAFVKYAQNATI